MDVYVTERLIGNFPGDTPTLMTSNITLKDHLIIVDTGTQVIEITEIL